MNRYRLVPGIIAAWVLLAGLTLITVALKSPYTHSNLVAGPQADYARTPQTLVGVAPAPFHGPGLADAATAANQVQRGRELLIANQCATCHGITGRGGSVNKPIVGFTVADLRTKTSQGPGDMPSFGTTLSDDDLAAIVAYLDSMKATPAN
jgi:mono/diheme cytochrome c family protein